MATTKRNKLFRIQAVSERDRKLYAAGLYTSVLIRLRKVLDKAGVAHELPAKFPKEK